MSIGLIQPDWPAPANIGAVITTRNGGVSQPPFDSANLGDHVGDKAEDVQQNRANLEQQLSLARAPRWLEQVHGTEIVDAAVSGVNRADGSYSRESGRVCVVMTADCLPVLLCNSAGTQVAAVHAGWRGLAGGILRRAIELFANQPGELLTYLGPCIGPQAFEVGREVREAFIDGALSSAHQLQIESCFAATEEGKYLADLAGLARAELTLLAGAPVYGGGYCTYTDKARFYSYRRDQRTGRNASLIWLR